MAQQYSEHPIRPRRQAQWTARDVLAFIDRQAHRGAMVRNVAAVARAAVTLVFSDRLGEVAPAVRYSDGDHRWVALDFAATSGHPHAKRVAEVFAWSVSEYERHHPVGIGEVTERPTGAVSGERLAAGAPPNTRIEHLLESCYGPRWKDRHPITAEIEALISQRAVALTTKRGLLSSYRRAVRALNAAEPGLNLAEVRDRRQAVVDDDFSPTGHGLLNTVEVEHIGGRMSRYEASAYRTATRVVLRGLFGESWEYEPLTNRPLEPQLKALAKSGSLPRDHFTHFRASVELYRQTQFVPWKIDVNPPRVRREWKATDSFPPTARGIVGFLQSEIDKGDKALKSANPASAVKWVIEKALHDNNWEEASLERH